ncbi:hypothetical protein BX659_11534 [Orenia metallireducens]|jgi:hypothetical protein|uniref:Uncharacterized protein n=1 Tax=Orenia metallireducens TaxID=1413210 RepID=A0A285HD84_9FIRM|nr:hypothetical protein [Orenia metallireducens]PRX27708.1 hypothetical protein BX659_11534 [Orenia metallireducens]SNY33543.1 hypothetical protein SAMN06265827_11734 [Orenia metallireducens]
MSKKSSQKYHDDYYPPKKSERGVAPADIVRELDPLVDYALEEGRKTGLRHAIMEVMLVSYLMGMGFDYDTAYMIVESWEVNERFPGEYDYRY